MIQRGPEPERPGRRRPDRPASRCPQGQQFQFTHEHAGPARPMPSSSPTSSSRPARATTSRAARRAQVVRLRDVARVELGAQQYDQICHLDGKPSVGLAVFQLPGSNALQVADAIKAKMEELKQELSRRARIPDRLRHDAVHSRVGRRGVQDAARRGDPGRHRRAVLPAGLEGDDPADDRRAGVAGRHVRRHGGAWASA